MKKEHITNYHSTINKTIYHEGLDSILCLQKNMQSTNLFLASLTSPCLCPNRHRLPPNT
ncbi:hypothetical protein Hanom_Chr08g00715721 [Helianthus anomalus]